MTTAVQLREPVPELEETPARRIRIDGPEAPRSTTALVLSHNRYRPGDAALDVALDLARRLHAHLHVVHGIDLSIYPIDLAAADWAEQARGAVEDQRARVASALADGATGWSYHAGTGHPADLARTVADEVDAAMIIVAGRGVGADKTIDRVLGGRSRCGSAHPQHRPVLVVPPPA
ncbi:universal stress protein [Pseudonocardia sp. GCM10023141]|uniref:universal stress protein n=1 Tax=Pseudonocardia sp. GCM10023141 TaxID=3252653 RepID=UPI00360B4361